MQDDSNFKKLISKINVACVINTQHMHTYTRVTVLSLCVYHRRRKMLQVVGAEYRVARNFLITPTLLPNHAHFCTILGL